MVNVDLLKKNHVKNCNKVFFQNSLSLSLYLQDKMFWSFRF